MSLKLSVIKRVDKNIFARISKVSKYFPHKISVYFYTSPTALLADLQFSVNKRTQSRPKIKKEKNLY